MLIQKWHKLLNMNKHDYDWHMKDLQDELEEYNTARGLFHKWSELADVVYVYSRAKHNSDCKELKNPVGVFKTFIGWIYMYPKYTLRWSFYRFIGNKFGKKISEIRNYKKEHKLKHIAEKHGIPEKEFIALVNKYKKYWLFLP